jgi:voltage-gated potassium channel
MAGANKIIDTYQVSANKISNMLAKPVATKFIDRLFSPKEPISFKQIVVPKYSILDGITIDDFDFNQFNVILIGLIDKELSNKFIFVTSGLNHKIDADDTLVCIGYEKDIKRFQTAIGA